MRMMIMLTLLALVYATTTLADVWTDEFDAELLDPGWTFNNRGNHASTMALTDGTLVMHVPAGTNDLVPGTDRAPTLTRQAPSGDYVVTILHTGMTAINAAGGILIFQDILNQMQLLYGMPSGSKKVWFMGAVNGAVPAAIDKDGNVRGVGYGHHLFTGDLGEVDQVYLRLAKVGNTYTSNYRLHPTDGWEQWLSLDIPLQEAQVGFIVKNWGGGAALTAAFEFFELEAENLNLAVDWRHRLPIVWGQLKRE